MKPFANNQDTTVNECFAVIDTETSWQDKVISIGVVIAQKTIMLLPKRIILSHRNVSCLLYMKMRCIIILNSSSARGLRQYQKCEDCCKATT